MWTGHGNGASEDRVPVSKRWPVLAPGDSGRGEPGWLLVAIGETGVDICQTRTGRLLGLSWEDLYTFNPSFNIDAVLADDIPPAEPVEPAAPAKVAPLPPPLPKAVAAPAPVAAAPAPAPAPTPAPAGPAPAFKLTVGRALAVPDGQGGIAAGRWEVAEVGSEGVVASHAGGGTVRHLTWGQVLTANPDFLPPTSRARMADGRLGLLISYNDQLVTIEGSASYQDSSLGLRSHAYVGQQYTEAIEVFAARNVDRIG